MSLFLGPIHYWLYNKIGNQEKLTTVIAVKADQQGWIEDISPYIKELPELETAIDGSNIHGWLQGHIIDAESRFARLITDIKNKGIGIEEVEKTALDFGKNNSPDAGADASEIYEYFENFFVNGMPCDHINTVTQRSEELVSWEMLQDIHADYWTQGNVSDYYRLRKAVMDGMLDKLGYEVETGDLYHYVIHKN